MTIPAEYGEQIHAYVTDEVGATMCPHCDLEMACMPGFAAYYCGDGHWISERDVRLSN